MEINVLKDILIEKGQVDKYFEGLTPNTNLWRAVKVKYKGSPFDFVEEAYILSNGRPRPADIKIEAIQGVKWVKIKDRPRGVSTFDKSGVPPGKGWRYYEIPKRTKLPEGLAIVKDEKNSRFDATHYTIAPAKDMPLAEFKDLLNDLALQIERDKLARAKEAM